MPATLIAEAYFAGEAGTLAYSATVLAARVATTIAINSLISKDVASPNEGAQTGGRVQLPAATNNKLPVVYGDAWVSPVIVDAKISPDQQEMIYVLALTENTDAGTITFGDVYWDDKRLLFDPEDPSKIWGWFVEGDAGAVADNTIITGVAGKIEMWFYKNGATNPTTHHCVSKAEPYTGSELPTTVLPQQMQWTDSAGTVTSWFPSTFKMNNTAFAIVRVKYDQDHGVTGLGQLRFQVKNTLKQPGSVMKDYLLNTRYGCAVPASAINNTSFETLDTYSGLELTIGSTYIADRYQINGIIDTGRDCLSNLVLLADSTDSWVQWNEETGQWGVLINRNLTESGFTTSTMRVVKSKDIIGGIQVTPLDINSTYNSVNVQFPNATIRDQSDFRLLSIAQASRYTGEPNNQLSLNLPLINNDAQATYIGWKRLYASRNDVVITFTMNYSGIEIDAGEIIAVNHEWYKWGTGLYGDGTYPGKPFRVTQVREIKNSDGSLTASITATAYNDQDYIPGEHFATTQQFSGITNPEFIGNSAGGVLTPPTAPYFPVEYINPSNGTFVIRADLPSNGNVITMEYWYSSRGSDLGNNNFYLHSAQQYVDGTVYPKKTDSGETFYEEALAYDLPTGNYYWRVRARGLNTVSEFSPPSELLGWDNRRKAISGGQIIDNSMNGTKVATGDPQKQGSAQGGGFFDTLGPIATAGLGIAALGAGYKKGWFDGFIPKDTTPVEAGNDVGEDPGVSDPTVDRQYETPDGEPTDNPQPGDREIITCDATPQPDPPQQVAQMDDYDVPAWEDNGDNSSWG